MWVSMSIIEDKNECAVRTLPAWAMSTACSDRQIVVKHLVKRRHTMCDLRQFSKQATVITYLQYLLPVRVFPDRIAAPRGPPS